MGKSRIGSATIPSVGIPMRAEGGPLIPLWWMGLISLAHGPRTAVWRSIMLRIAPLWSVWCLLMEISPPRTCWDLQAREGLRFRLTILERYLRRPFQARPGCWALHLWGLLSTEE